MNGIQLEMNFDGPRGNRFREKMNNGIFQVLVEVTPPLDSLPLEDAIARYSDIEYAVSSRTELSAVLAFLDNSTSPEKGMDTVRFASALCKMDRDRHLLCVSGRSRSIEQIDLLLNHAANEGFRNILALSGGTVPGDSVKTVRNRHYTESVHILQEVKSHLPELINAGCSVNPYSYVPETLFPQYFKLIKKINQGASFIVTQYGWDMKKLQELRWFLASRSTHLPSIARILFLTPDRVKELCSGKISGVYISPDLEAMLRREMSHSIAQFEAAQWRRIQIHAAGVKFLGYSGIQIAGVDRPESVNVLLNRISEALAEFTSFEDWIAAYNDYYERLDLAPYPYHFYEFEDLLSTAQPPEQLTFGQTDIIPPTSFEQFAYRVKSKLFAHADTYPASEKRLTKKLFVACHSCNACRLPQMNFICPENCPKGFANGPCGAVGVDGTCEFGFQECIHSRRMRFANWLNECPTMEENCIPPLEKL